MNKLFSNIWTKIKAWFNYSWSIFIARLEVLSGFLIGALGGVDWTALINLNWQDAVYSKTNLLVAALIVLKGIVSELGRRAGTVTTTTDQLVATNIAAKADLPLKK